MAKIVFGFSLAWLLVPGYAIAGILTWCSTEEFVDIAWDSAGCVPPPASGCRIFPQNPNDPLPDLPGTCFQTGARARPRRRRHGQELVPVEA